MALVYKITNKINGKIYIGETTRTLEQRWKEHCLHAKNYEYGSLLHAAIRKYGENNFIKEVIEDNIPDDIVLEVETSYIIDYNSNDHSIGYNNTLNEKNNVIYIKDEEIIKKIIDLLKNTNMSYKDIGRIMNINTGVIKTISRGIHYRIEGIEYPIRPIHSRLTTEEVLEIAKYLKYTKLSINRIADLMNCNEKKVWKIDEGKAYSKILLDNGYKIPIRNNSQIRILNRDNGILENIVEALKDVNKYPNIADISNDLNINMFTIAKTNTGIKYKDMVLEKYPNITYPIRKIKLPNRLSEDNLKMVIELLLYTSLTTNQICEFLSLYGTECTGSLYRVNTGARYKDKVLKLFPNIEFPIRKNKNKRIVFTEPIDIKKEKEILSKYKIDLNELSVSYGEKLYNLNN